MKRGFLYLLFSFVFLSVSAQQQTRPQPNLKEAEDFTNKYFDLKEFSLYVSERLPEGHVEVLDTPEFRDAVRNFYHKERLKVMMYYQQRTLTEENVGSFLDSVRIVGVALANELYQDAGKRHFFIDKYADNHSHDRLTQEHVESLKTQRGAGEPCTNADFEAGNTSGWELFRGSVNGSAQYSYVNVNPTGAGANHTIYNGGNDPVVPAIPRVNPDGGQYSLRLGDGTGTNNGAASIRQTFLVTTNSASFTYSYAALLQDAGHPSNQQPYFRIRMYDEQNNVIQCGDYQVIAGPVNSGGDPDFTLIQYSGEALYYKNWTTVFAPLHGYINRNVTIEFIVGDCSQNGHFGYAYLDARCSSMEFQIAATGGGCGPVNVIAPPGAASYLWSGPGVNGQTTQTVTANASGTYSVTMTPVTGSACTLTIDTALVINTIHPTANFTTDSPVCIGSPVNFTDASQGNGAVISGWSWNFGDGTPISTQQNPQHLYASTGTFNATLTVTTQSGCTDQITLPVTVAVGTVPTITPAAPVCADAAPFIMTASQPGGVWTADCHACINATTGEFNPSAAGPGDHQVTYTVSGLCVASDSEIVRIEGVAIDAINIADVNCASDCNGQIAIVASGNVASYSIDGGITTSPSPVFPNLCSGNYTIVVASTSGCNTTAPAVVGAPANSLQLSLNVIGETCDRDCDGQITAVVTGGTTPYYYQWSTGDNVPTISNLCAGPFSINVIDAAGCLVTANTNINSNPIPVVSFTADTTAGCAPLLIQFTNPTWDANIESPVWDFGDGTTSTEGNPSHVYTQPGCYDVSLHVTAQGGCSESYAIAQYICVAPSPSADFVFGPQPANLLDPAINFTNLSAGATSYSWDFGGLATSNAVNPRFEFPDTDAGTYLVCLSVENAAGCADSTCRIVVIDDYFVIYVPNAFTPDGDGRNDLFIPVMNSIVPGSFEMTIYNRWGEPVFASNDLLFTHWDGSHKGDKAPVGVYVWKITVKDAVLGKKRTYTGHVNLIR